MALRAVSVLLACLGVFIAGTLSVGHLLNLPVPCGSSFGCQTVAQHASSKFAGVPVAFFGLGAYLFILAMLLLRSFTGQRIFAVGAFIASLLGTAISAYLTYVALTQIRATCGWCIASAMTMTLLAITTCLVARKPSEQPRDKGSWLLLGASMLVLAGVGIELERRATIHKALTVRLDEQALEVLGKEALLKDPVYRIGDKDAAVTIVEFADLACSACRDMHFRLKNVVDKIGGLQIVFHHLPFTQIRGHEASFAAATGAEVAAEEGKFWEYIDRVYALQQEKKPVVLLDVAKDLDLNLKSFQASLEDDQSAAATRVKKDMELARRLDINQTPTFIVLTPEGDRLSASSLGVIKLLTETDLAEHLKPRS